MEVNKKDYKLKKANFIKVNIDIKEEPNITFWVGLLTMLPIPLFIVKLFAGLAADYATQHAELPITKNDILDILNSCHGTNVQIDTDDVTVDVQIY